MRFLVVSIVLVALGGGMAACTERSGGGDPVGVWTLDPRAIQASLLPRLRHLRTLAEKAPEVDREVAKQMLAEAEQKFADVLKFRYVLELRGDGSATFEAEEPGLAPETSAGVWARRNDRVTVTIHTKQGKPYEGSPDDQAKTLVLKGDTLTLSDQGMPYPMVFRR